MPNVSDIAAKATGPFDSRLCLEFYQRGFPLADAVGQACVRMDAPETLPAGSLYNGAFTDGSRLPNEVLMQVVERDNQQ